MVFRALRAKSEGRRVRFHPDVLKAYGFEPRAESPRINRNECVVDMKQPHAQALAAVDASQDAAGFQYSPHLPKQLVLQRGRRHVMQHGEGYRPGELGASKGHGGGIAANHSYGSAVQTRRQRFGQPLVNFDRGQSFDEWQQQFGGQPRPRPDFKHVRSEFDIA